MNQKLSLGRQEANQHLGDGGAGVGDGLGAAAAAVEGVTSVENGLAVLGLQGHFALEDVVDGFQGVSAVVASAAGNKVGDTLDHLAAVNVSGIVQTGGDALVVAGSSVGVDGGALYALGSLDLVLCHNKNFLSKVISVAKITSYFISLAQWVEKCNSFAPLFVTKNHFYFRPVTISSCKTGINAQIITLKFFSFKVIKYFT